MSTSRNSEWPLPFTKPEEVGFSSEWLARIRPALQKFIDQQKVPNLVTMIARDGKIVHFDAQGYMDFDSKRPASRDTIFRLYSNSKPITGVATMILYEDGRLNLDDPVSKYIPAFKNPVVRVPDTTEGAIINPPLYDSHRTGPTWHNYSRLPAKYYWTGNTATFADIFYDRISGRDDKIRLVPQQYTKSDNLP